MDIFDAYTKRMQKRGLLKSSAITIHDDGQSKPKESKELKSYKDDVYPRMDSRSIKDIEKIYGVKGDTVYEYEKNIAEDAHPNSLIMFPAYDKMNALVENINERQRINLNIMRQPPSGLEYRQKYAQEMLQSLISTANDMGFQHKSNLSKLADRTITLLKKEAFDWSDLGDFGNKLKGYFQEGEDIVGGASSGAELGAIAGGLIGVYAGGLGGAWTGAKLGGELGAALGGVLSAIVKTAPIAKNVQINAKIASNKLAPLIKDHPNDLFLTQLQDALTHIQDTASTYTNLVSAAQTNQNGSASKAQEVGQAYIQEIHKLDTMIDVFINNAENGNYVSGQSDWLSKIESPFKSILGDDIHDAIGAFKTLETVSEQAIDSIQHAKTFASSLGTTPPANTGTALNAGESEMDVLRKALSGNK